MRSEAAEPILLDVRHFLKEIGSFDRATKNSLLREISIQNKIRGETKTLKIASLHKKSFAATTFFVFEK